MRRQQTHRKGAAVRGYGATAALVSALLWAAPPVRAQPAAAESDQAAVQAQQQAEQERAMTAMDMEARQHFSIGKTLYEAGRFQQAAEEFEQAYQLSKRPQLLYNLYVANRDAGKLPEATAALSGYLEQVPEAPDRINLRARLESMQMQTARQAEQEERARKATEEAERARAATRTRKVTEHSNVPWYLVGAGGAMLATSLATGIVAKSKSDTLAEHCADDRCPPSESDTIQQAQRLALTTDVLWGAGAASAITGLVLWWTGALDQEREVPVASVSVGPQSVMANWKARF